jgi:hypothetical protein
MRGSSSDRIKTNPIPKAAAGIGLKKIKKLPLELMSDSLKLFSIIVPRQNARMRGVGSKSNFLKR